MAAAAAHTRGTGTRHNKGTSFKHRKIREDKHLKIREEDLQSTGGAASQQAPPFDPSQPALAPPRAPC